MVSLGASNFVYFYTYNAFKAVYRNMVVGDKKADIGAITNLLIASTAGVVNVLATTPLWVAGTRLTVQNKKAIAGNDKGSSSSEKPYTGVFDCLTRIVKNEGEMKLPFALRPPFQRNLSRYSRTMEWSRTFASARVQSVHTVRYL